MSQEKTVMTREQKAKVAEDLNALLRRADKGDQKATAKLREILRDQHQHWEALGNMAKHAETALVRMVAGENDIVAQAIHRKVDEVRQDVLGPSSSPLERLLAERIALCWLQLTYAETVYAQNAKELSLRQSEFHQRRLDRCQQRYLAAIRALAQIRRLALPAIQVNVGQQQVNVAGGA